MRSGKIFPVFSGFCKIYENHPWKRIIIRRDAMSGEESSLEEIFVGRDEISREESSLEEDFCWQG